MSEPIDVTTMHSIGYVEKIPQPKGANQMAEQGQRVKAREYRPVTGYEAFHWPEFQAFAKRLGISIGDPIVDITIQITSQGVVQVTTLTNGLDTTKERK